ncbi:MAG TPA: helicase-related protein [Thermoanaerobaculia bacterium]
MVFTESRRTQAYLQDFLGKQGYAGEIVLMNGTNTDPGSRAIYESWKERHAHSDVVSRSKSADTKAAIVEEFRDRATLLIATESAAEGVNLQFCSLVVNYDLPWNPQRIEQRIGRCHRYGQKHDVVVVNFLNKRNEADQRVYQLLAEKFKLFDGVFGASDQVLGALESGVDIERRIAQVYQECRTAEDIQAAFDTIQAELDEQISSRMDETRKNLLENFDIDVHARIKLRMEESERALNSHQELLRDLTRAELAGDASWEGNRFRYHGTLGPAGTYNFDWKSAEAANEIFYRADHPLARKLIESAAERDLPAAHVRFDLTSYGAKISALEPFIGKSGWLRVVKTTITSLEAEDRLDAIAASDDGQLLDDDLARKLFALNASIVGDTRGTSPADVLDNATKVRVADHVASVESRNAKHFDEEVVKLELWAEDLKYGLEQELKELDREIRDIRRATAGSGTLAEKLAGQKKLKELDAKKKKKRAELFDAQDTIDEKRDTLIGEIEQQLQQCVSTVTLFTVRWTLA